jgi:hypothetical protein
MLIIDTGITDRHIEPGKWGHLGAKGDMFLCKGRLLHGQAL